MRGLYARFGLAAFAGVFIWAIATANFGEAGLIIGAVFGIASAYFAYEFLTRRAEERLTREKWKDGE